MATVYGAYQPLDESQRQIRLITIHAVNTSGDVDSEAAISCTLETVALRDANPFYALSYVWGPLTPTGPVTINGQTIHVRRNLWLFLHALRARFCPKSSNQSSNRTSIRVWADYVCIQQTDVRERNFQVAMMGDIYKASDAIYAWLGESAVPIDDGMQCIADIAALRKRRLSWSQIREDVGNTELRLQGVSTSQYWNRMWIKQEALLAKDLWFFYGEAVAHWQDMSFAIQLRPARMDRQSQTMSSRAMLSLFQARESGRVKYELHDLVEKFADASCLDPRDRIYAMLALVDQKTSQRIVVDYQKPVLQVLVENYRYWSSGGIVSPTQARVELESPGYHLGHFCKVVHKFLPRTDFDVLCRSKDARSQITADAAFVATDISSVAWVRPIATFTAKSIDPVWSDTSITSGKRAFVSRIGLRPYRSHANMPPRDCFVYSDIVPDVGMLVVWLGSRLLFWSAGDMSIIPVDIAEPRLLIGMGSEVRERGLMKRGGDRLSRQFLPHPCLWLGKQLEDTRFVVHGFGSRSKPNDVFVICDGAAIILLLDDDNTDKETSQIGSNGESSSDTVSGVGVPRLWSPYTFGLEHKLLQPCELCRSTGRSAALSKKASYIVDQLSCECNWNTSQDYQRGD